MEQNSLLDQFKKATEGKLSPDFVIELIKCCFTSQKIFDICKQHLKYHYLQSEAQKKVVKFLYDTHSTTNVVPTIGVTGQTFATDREVIALLAQVKKVDVHNDAHDTILNQFESFIKKSRFIALYTKVGELFNQGKQEEAIQSLDKESEEIANFKLKEKFYTRLFAEYENRVEQRSNNRDTKEKRYCQWGIHELDDVTRGIEYGRSALLMARSGGGKSTMLKWVGLVNGRQGKRVVHFQAEGTEDECKVAYDAAWTGIALDDMEMGNIPSTSQVKIKKAHKDILSNGGEIFIYGVEQFDSLSIEQCREIIIDIEKIYGKVDLVIFDYLEKFTLLGSYNNNESAERKRRMDIADKITNIATEFKCAVLTATQANDVKVTDYNKADFVLTRNHLAEVKPVVNPFSYFITINQTDDEYENGIARLYCDKLRKSKRGKVVRIYQALNQGRFYDSMKTVQHFYNKAA
jgi:energy-coupling factor transporter ATP-binding protein EcfA2/chaperonin cofactor prefoldin